MKVIALQNALTCAEHKQKNASFNNSETDACSRKLEKVPLVAEQLAKGFWQSPCHSMGPSSFGELDLHISFGVLRACSDFRPLWPEGRSIIMPISPPMIAI